jgi:hypothetical protein
MNSLFEQTYYLDFRVRFRRTKGTSPFNNTNSKAILVVLESCHQNLHDIYQCRMYSRKLLMIGRGTARNDVVS